ncbi:Hsp20-like protein [Schizosaccharomyces pombe]|uniref:Heat shock protein homolog C338.06c n=1 Tax=Schizosaccharomyces pombe (strain 972 / ATCC 24843) TaxID=284812 RepID=HSP15_SCHPO|nr:putative Hsp20 family protein [Schizosaccharomyces pombe]O74984.1 RecName: Full=Heat shock protein homolog C338.06c [Schizosaccharomyces pombe 972h-]CAA19337.1 heat shock protein Hsp20 family (predicted) [Schizosaccharomyces pombe]|eukprot:NP_588161.1 putative Hsp20 family protein [Schizosaccharomyces pombe]
MLFDAFTNGFMNDIFEFGDRSKFNRSAWLSCWGPALELRETEDTIEVDVEVPGIDKQNLKVDLHGSKLTISGERKKPEEEKAGPLIRWSERCVGAFSRTITLPQPVDEKLIHASLNNGILSIVMKKKNPEFTTRIVEIQ